MHYLSLIRRIPNPRSAIRITTQGSVLNLDLAFIDPVRQWDQREGVEQIDIFTRRKESNSLKKINRFVLLSLQLIA